MRSLRASLSGSGQIPKKELDNSWGIRYTEATVPFESGMHSPLTHFTGKEADYMTLRRSSVSAATRIDTPEVPYCPPSDPTAQ